MGKLILTEEEKKSILKLYLNEDDYLSQLKNFFRPNKKQQTFRLEDIVSPNTWTHATLSDELMNTLKQGNSFIGKKEDLRKFNIPHKGPFATFVNQHSPNFLKGGIFHGFKLHPYLITTELPDEAFQPNWNSKNYNSFEESANVGVLKPDYRNASNFRLWKKVGDNEYIEY